MDYDIDEVIGYIYATWDNPCEYIESLSDKDYIFIGKSSGFQQWKSIKVCDQLLRNITKDLRLNWLLDKLLTVSQWINKILRGIK